MVYTKHILVFFKHDLHILGLCQEYEYFKKRILGIYQAHDKTFKRISVVYTKSVIFILGMYLVYPYIKYLYVAYL